MNDELALAVWKNEGGSMQEFRPLERAVSKTARLLRSWDEYTRELRKSNVGLRPKDHIIMLLQEHPMWVWRPPDSLVKESGYNLSCVMDILNSLVADGIVALKWINSKQFYATKVRADMQPGWAGEAISDDFHYEPDSHFDPDTHLSAYPDKAKDMFSELEKILKDACLKVKEAAKINEQLFNLDVTSSKNTAIR